MSGNGFAGSPISASKITGFYEATVAVIESVGGISGGVGMTSVATSGSNLLGNGQVGNPLYLNENLNISSLVSNNISATTVTGSKVLISNASVETPSYAAGNFRFSTNDNYGYHFQQYLTNSFTSSIGAAYYNIGFDTVLDNVTINSNNNTFNAGAYLNSFSNINGNNIFSLNALYCGLVNLGNITPYITNSIGLQIETYDFSGEPNKILNSYGINIAPLDYGQKRYPFLLGYIYSGESSNDLAINNNGSLAIGKRDANAKLDVNGNVLVTGSITGSHIRAYDLSGYYSQFINAYSDRKAVILGENNTRNITNELLVTGSVTYNNYIANDNTIRLRNTTNIGTSTGILNSVSISSSANVLSSYAENCVVTYSTGSITQGIGGLQVTLTKSNATNINDANTIPEVFGIRINPIQFGLNKYALIYSSSADECLSIDGNGNLAVGKKNANSKLDVNGNVLVTGSIAVTKTLKTIPTSIIEITSSAQQIIPDTTLIKVSSSSPYSLNSTPTILVDGYDEGSRLTIVNVGASAITYSDDATLSGSKLKLSTSTYIQNEWGCVQLVLVSGSTGKMWVETSRGA